MPVLLEIPENPNCPAMDAQVFQCRSVARVVTHVLHERAGGVWDLNDPAQWGVPYLLLAGDASALRFG